MTINICIPMAGLGKRFREAGYTDPKPLIPINGVPMIRWVIDNLKPKIDHRFIFVCQQSHIETYHLTEKLSLWAPGCEVIGIEGVTDGAACTVLAARDLIDNEFPLMIANSDQYIDVSIDSYISEASSKHLDGMIMTMKANDPKWSFVVLDENNFVSIVVEKQVISDEATVGIYNFSKGSDFVSAADEMINKNLRVNNEFYVAPSYNELLGRGAKIGTYNIGKQSAGMHGLGTPEDLDCFLSLDISQEKIPSL